MKWSAPEAVATIDDAKENPSVMSDFMAITKARLTFLVLITTFVGFLMASQGPLDWTLLLNTLIGTTLVAASAAVLNQAIEANVDRFMERTQDRPLPSGRWREESASMWGGAAAAVGLAYLAVAVNLVSSLLALATLGIYLLVYTPLKRISPICVTIGAISGAIPPLIGWTAVEPRLGTGAWVLFGVLFLWQMPHFLAIAWMYRDEYANAGFHMLHHDDVDGSHTAWRALLNAVGLMAVTLVPFATGAAGLAYLSGALLLNGLMIGTAIMFLLHRTRSSARQMFFASILYLPLILGLMVLTRS